jgi:hypothetical protein
MKLKQLREYEDKYLDATFKIHQEGKRGTLDGGSYHLSQEPESEDGPTIKRDMIPDEVETQNKLF